MPIDFERLRIAVGEDAKVGVFVERAREVDQVTVSLRDESGVGETRADGFGISSAVVPFGTSLVLPSGSFK